MKRIAILLVLLAGCVIDPTPPIAETRVAAAGHPNFTLTTIKHDGHLFVVCSDVNGVGVILHPDDGKAERESK